MREVTIRLAHDGSLDRLLEGQWACLVWLSDNGDGTYGLHAGGVANGEVSLGEAYLRTGYELAFENLPVDHPDWKGRPPVAQTPPNETVANMMERIRTRLGWHGTTPE